MRNMKAVKGIDGWYIANEDGELEAGPYKTKQEAIHKYREEYMFFA